jgi:hypothetical protein
MKFKNNVRPENYVNICSDNQAALKALQAAKTNWCDITKGVA